MAASQFPEKLRKQLSVIFDGVDTKFFKPNTTLDLENSSVTIAGENSIVCIEPKDLLLSYATRGMEPLRGFPEFMRTLPSLLSEFPNLKVIVGGRDRSAYGPEASSHEGSWLKKMLDELPSLKTIQESLHRTHELRELSAAAISHQPSLLLHKTLCNKLELV